MISYAIIIPWGNPSISKGLSMFFFRFPNDPPGGLSDSISLAILNPPLPEKFTWPNSEEWTAIHCACRSTSKIEVELRIDIFRLLFHDSHSHSHYIMIYYVGSKYDIILHEHV